MIAADYSHRLISHNYCSDFDVNRRWIITFRVLASIILFGIICTDFLENFHNAGSWFTHTCKVISQDKCDDNVWMNVLQYTQTKLFIFSKLLLLIIR